MTVLNQNLGSPYFLMILIIGGEMKKLKKFASQKKLATIAKNLMQSTSVYLFHDHVIVKEKKFFIKNSLAY